MTPDRPDTDSRRSRWLPVTVVSLFALIFLIDAVVIVVYGNYRNLIEKDDVEVMFVPAGVDRRTYGEAYEVIGEEPIEISDGEVLLRSKGDRIEVLAPGTVVFRFRSPDAGRFVVLDYRFGARRSPARCEVSLARAASRYGVDTLHRKSLVAKRQVRGKFRRYLADHAGWFELSIEVDAAAAQIGFEISIPTIVPE